MNQLTELLNQINEDAEKGKKLPSMTVFGNPHIAKGGREWISGDQPNPWNRESYPAERRFRERLIEKLN